MLKNRFKRALTICLMSVVFLFTAVAPAMAATYAGPYTFGVQLDTHNGTITDGNIHLWRISPYDHGSFVPNSMQFTNSSSLTLNVRIYANNGSGDYTLYSGSLGNGTHSISFDCTSYRGPSTVYYLQIVNANFSSANYSFMYS